MLRKIIKIDEDKCDGCGECVPNCHEGALQIIDEKARLISDLFCDGLGACIGHCPQDAISIEEREAEPYNERKVMEYIVSGGENVIIAHLKHLLDHKELGFYDEAINYLEENNIDINLKSVTEPAKVQTSCGCPGSQELNLKINDNGNDEEGKRSSHLQQWPIQMHLVSPYAQYYQNSHLLLAADCVGFAYADFHKDYLNGKSIAIACPKLDTNKEVYSEKLTAMIKDANLQSITVMIMQVPCCGGLMQLAKDAIDQSGKEIPVKVIVIGVQGEVLQETALVYN
ncbi:ATP-binding protein [Bacteroidota bacterium]